MKNINTKNIVLSFVIAGLLLCLGACGAKEIQGIDSAQWKADQYLITGYRQQAMTPQMVSTLEKDMPGWNEIEVISFFGLPNETELYERNQKFLVYYISAGDSTKNIAPKAFQVRLSAVNVVTEVGYNIR